MNLPDPAAFVLARVAETETVARAAGMPLPDDERDTPPAAGLTLRTWQDPDGSWVIDNEDGMGGNGYVWGEALAAHIARHDPARVLAWCAALRAIVAEHATQNVPVLEVCGETVMSGPKCRTCADWANEDMDGPPHMPAPCPTLRAVAGIWAGHPDFDPSWR